MLCGCAVAVRWTGSSRVFSYSAAFVACAAPPSTAIASGAAAPLVPDPTRPELTGALIGPLVVRGPYPAGSTNATALGFVRGRPFKILVRAARDTDGDVALTGVRRSDGQPLRF